MYNQFVKNMKNYMTLNYSEGSSANIRYDLVKSMDILMDIDGFLKYKEINHSKYYEVANIIYEINNNIDKYPSFKVLSWELIGYGFDAKKSFDCDSEKLEEQLRIIDLLLSTQYWN